jgi:NAD(P)-dependent dehydrogenase (short-subunit alcohol dehydrogenase family)
VAVITGGARGIGLACAHWFLAREHRVALIDIDNDTLQLTLVDLAARVRSGELLGLHADVSAPTRWPTPSRASTPRSAVSTRWSTTPAWRCSSASTTPHGTSGST